MKIASLFTFFVARLVLAQNTAICELCRNHRRPAKKNTWLYTPYVSGNCQQIYILGKTGKIDPKYCYILQIIAEQPCGCNLPVRGPRRKSHNSSVDVSINKLNLSNI